MHYPLSEKYNTPELMGKIMGPNPMKLEEELLTAHQIPAGSVVCDLGSGQGLTGYPNKTVFSQNDPRIFTMDGCYVAVIE